MSTRDETTCADVAERRGPPQHPWRVEKRVRTGTWILVLSTDREDVALKGLALLLKTGGDFRLVGPSTSTE